MNADEIVATIRRLMPCINDCMDLYEYERQALTQAADIITSQQAEIDRLTAMNKEAVELLGLAVEDINRMELTTQCVNYILCLSKAKSMKQAVLPCDNCSSWKWQHADRYEAIKKRMEEPSHDLQ